VAIVYDPAIIVGHLAHHRPDDSPGFVPPLCARSGCILWHVVATRRSIHRTTCSARSAAGPLAPSARSRHEEFRAGLNGRGEVMGLLPGILAGLRNRGVRPARGKE
jgi:hypothetical protein